MSRFGDGRRLEDGDARFVGPSGRSEDTYERERQGEGLLHGVSPLGGRAPSGSSFRLPAVLESILRTLSLVNENYKEDTSPRDQWGQVPQTRLESILWAPQKTFL